MIEARSTQRFLQDVEATPASPLKVAGKPFRNNRPPSCLLTSGGSISLNATSIKFFPRHHDHRFCSLSLVCNYQKLSLSKNPRRVNKLNHTTKIIRDPEPDVISPDHAMLLGVKKCYGLRFVSWPAEHPSMTSVQQ